MVNFKTLVLGASLKPERYAYRAVQMLQERNFEVIAMGRGEGFIGKVSMTKPFAKIPPVHTVTFYLGPVHQEEYLDFILKLNPQRVIFNPGTENREFPEKLTKAGIAWENSCTLVLLSTNQYQP
jgi:predicted CoA-binding protein